MFRSVLIANRGEIACRVARTLKRLGIRSIAVYSDADREALHVKAADEAFHIGPAPVRDSYLNLEALMAVVAKSGAEAVHPGYGLLSESATLARAVAETGAIFIGPPPEVLDTFGDKTRARELARSVGVEPPPGTASASGVGDARSIDAEAARIGYPLMVKATAGGGGIGTLLVRAPEELSRAVRAAGDRARHAFGDDRVYLERYLERARHIEVQILGDASDVVALGERECSVQRRHQKVMEEAPSPAVVLAEGSRRARLHEAACSVARAAGYRNAGTVEFLVDANGDAHFLEVNARLQVEHPVTELVTGLDLVELQLQIASGEPIPEGARQVRPRGHAIEARLYAEDPARGFVPQPGRIERLVFPDFVRIESGIEAGTEVTPHYDPLVAKIVAQGETRTEALETLSRALDSTEIELRGPKGPRATNLEFLRRLCRDPELRSGSYDTGLVERMMAKAS